MIICHEVLIVLQNILFVSPLDGSLSVNWNANPNTQLCKVTVRFAAISCKVCANPSLISLFVLLRSIVQEEQVLYFHVNYFLFVNLFAGGYHIIVLEMYLYLLLMSLTDRTVL